MAHVLETLVVRPLKRLETVIITLRGDSFGSFELLRLQQLELDLQCARQTVLTSCARNVVIDLKGVSLLGSQCVRLLYQFVTDPARVAPRVLVCGDQTGVLRLCGAQRWLTLCDDLPTACASVGRSVYHC